MLQDASGRLDNLMVYGSLEDPRQMQELLSIVHLDIVV